MGFEPMMGVLQTPALTTWLRRLETDNAKSDGERPPSLWAPLVPRKGFEPLRPKARPPQDRVSASFTTSAEHSLAGVEGLEPPTYGFGDRCSSQLSYTPMLPEYSNGLRSGATERHFPRSGYSVLAI